MQRFRTFPTRQRGLTMIGFLFAAVVLVFAAMLAMKLVPAYIEFFSVKKIIAAMGAELDLKSKSNAEIRSDFARRAGVGYVTAVKPEDILIDRRGGTTVVSVEYAFRAKLLGNTSVVADFSASTDPNAVPSQIE
ncbi:MAG: DUF4845 domain-containing protein [Thiobacillus sp.]